MPIGVVSLERPIGQLYNEVQLVRICEMSSAVKKLNTCDKIPCNILLLVFSLLLSC